MTEGSDIHKACTTLPKADPLPGYVSRRSENAHLLCTPDGSSIDLGTAPRLSSATSALATRHAPFNVR
jgi:hypothetical protein